MESKYGFARKYHCIMTFEAHVNLRSMEFHVLTKYSNQDECYR